MAFNGVIGHEALLRLIGRAVARETLPPSLLFVGPEGVGKRRVAVALAQVQNCSSVRSTGVAEVDACGECPTCLRIEKAAYTDVVLIEPGETGSITIDPVRNAIGQSTYRPFEGRRRVVIVVDADRLVVQAQNALLKTLEEPPDASQFVLTTSRPDLLLPTVRSRCQRLSFGRLTTDEVLRVLDRQIDRSPDTRAAAASAGGSAGRALELVSGELAASRAAAVALLRQVATAADARGRLEGAKRFIGKGRPGAASRLELRRRLDALMSLLRDVALVATGSDRGTLANADMGDGLESLARVYGGVRGVEAFGAVDRALEAVETNVSPKVVADWLAFQL